MHEIFGNCLKAQQSGSGKASLAYKVKTLCELPRGSHRMKGLMYNILT